MAFHSGPPFLITPPPSARGGEVNFLKSHTDNPRGWHTSLTQNRSTITIHNPPGGQHKNKRFQTSPAELLLQAAWEHLGYTTASQAIDKHAVTYIFENSYLLIIIDKLRRLK